MFRSLSVRNYRLFATGQLVKFIGVWALLTAQDWLVLELSGDSATALGWVTACQFTPVLLLSLYGGKLADRFDKRRLLIAANALFAVAAAVQGVLVVAGVARLWHIFALAATIGAVNAIEAPVRQAFVSELVRRELLPNALALSASTFNTARVVGPALAGVAIAWIDTGPVFLATALLGVAPLVTAVRMRPAELHRAVPGPAEPGRVEPGPAGRGAVAAADARIVDGLRYVWLRPDLSLPIALMLVVGAFGFNFAVTIAVLAKNAFHADAGSFGLLSTSLAVGALAGALAGTRRRARPSVYLVLTAAALFSVTEALVGFAGGFGWAAVALVPTGFFMILFAQSASQRVQLGTDAEYRGRVMALYVLVFFGTTPFGALLVGWCAEHLGPRSGLWLGGLASLVATVVAFVIQLRRAHGRIDLHLRPRPHVHVSEPARAGSPAIDLRVPRVRPAVR